MARRSDYQVFVSARMRALAPHGFEESRQAMRQVAGEWRTMNRSTNPPDDGPDNPMPRRRRYSRRQNPSNSMLKYLLIGGAIYFFLLRRNVV